MVGALTLVVFLGILVVFGDVLSVFGSIFISSWKSQVMWETRFVGGALTFGTNNWLSFELTPAN